MTITITCPAPEAVAWALTVPRPSLLGERDEDAVGRSQVAQAVLETARREALLSLWRSTSEAAGIDHERLADGERYWLVLWEHGGRGASPTREHVIDALDDKAGLEHVLEACVAALLDLGIDVSDDVRRLCRGGGKR